MTAEPAVPVIRSATPADLPRVVELIVLGTAAGRTTREDPADMAAYERALQAIDAGEGDLFVAQRDGEVIGACQLMVFRHIQARGGLCAEIESVHVHPDHRRGGVGAALIRHAIDSARDLGCYRVQLTSDVVRADAHRFYEGLGFQATHVGFKLYLDPPGLAAPGGRPLPNQR
jgi:GNAT superfamily N-acetyltransferase